MPRLLVIGSGIAGLTGALAAAEAGLDVTLLSKAALLESNTRYAQGGIAAAVGPEDSADLHAADTMTAGAGLNDARAVAALCAEAPSRVADLVERGVAFDSVGGMPVLAREAAHSTRRILHAGGDATGLAISAALVDAVRRSRVEVVEHAMLVDLVTVGGDVRGAEVLLRGARHIVEADAVLLATGGAGRLFLHTTNPAVATGDGIAAAWRAGARLRDLEFYQFHPTALAAPGTPLVSEAVRGEGAVLIDDTGVRFMLDEHPDAELAPRDVVARGIARAMARQGGRPVMLDATALGRNLRTRFPTITRSVEAAGLDWTRQPIPVTPAAHYLMGGVVTDLHGRATVRGLYVAGEAASTRVHGANRLASNSLVEGLVFAARAARAVEADLRRPRSAADSRPRTGASRQPGIRIGRPGPGSRAGLQRVMWQRVGLFRDEEGLRTALDELDVLASGTTVHGPDQSDPIRETEDLNLMTLAHLTAHAALARRESLGAHFRTDAAIASAPSRALAEASC